MSLVGRLTIDLECLADNWSALSRKIKLSRKVKKEGAIQDIALGGGDRFEKKPCEAAAVVKADAYGLGVVPVVLALYQKGCRTFFVANIHEALEVSNVLPAERVIYVLQGFSIGEESLFFVNNIQPVLTSLVMLESWLSSSSASASCAIKINTGMNRLGLSEYDFEQFVCKRKILNCLNVSLIMSHLACADDPSHSLNQLQLKRFLNVVNLSKQYGHPSIQFSLANSAGIFLGEEYFFDLVRPGISLYSGMLGNINLKSLFELKIPVALTLPVLNIRKVFMGESVGYGAEYILEKDSYIATVGGGYSDGLLCSMSGKASFVYQERSVSVVGRVSMDSFALDLGPGFICEDSFTSLGFVTVFDSKDSLISFAKACNTITYELLTSLGGRYKRFYLGDEFKKGPVDV